MSEVKFKFGTQSEYDSIINKDVDALYFISDTRRLYRGQDIVSSVNVLFVPSLPTFDDAEKDVLYVVVTDTGTHIYVKGTTKMCTVDIELGQGSILSLDAFASGIIITSTEIDNVSKEWEDKSLPTVGAMKQEISKVSSLEWGTI